MKRNTVVLTALVVFAPAALLAANDPPAEPAQAHAPGAGHAGRGDWFARLDTNQDSVVTRDELKAAQDRHLEQMFNSMDADHDGMITREEVQKAHEARRAHMQERFDERFKQADANGDGFLSKEEARSGMPRLGRAFDRLDTDKDGQLSREEIQARAHHMRGRMHGGRSMGHSPEAGSPPDAAPESSPQE